MLRRWIFRFAHWRWKTFIAPKLIQSLRDEGNHEGAELIEKERTRPAPQDQTELILATKRHLLARGRSDEAIQFSEIAKAIESWQSGEECSNPAVHRTLRDKAAPVNSARVERNPRRALRRMGNHIRRITLR